MSKVYNISDKMSGEKPTIIWGDKTLTVNTEVASVIKFQELSYEGGMNSLVEAVDVALGENHGVELTKLLTPDFEVLVTAISAAIHGITYEEAASRFRN